MREKVSMVDAERKWKELLDKIMDESKKRWRTINCKMTECLVLTKRDSPRWELHIKDIKIKQV